MAIQNGEKKRKKHGKKKTIKPPDKRWRQYGDKNVVTICRDKLAKKYEKMTIKWRKNCRQNGGKMAIKMATKWRKKDIKWRKNVEKMATKWQKKRPKKIRNKHEKETIKWRQYGEKKGDKMETKWR